MNKITLELTNEELFEAMFCVKYHSKEYPNWPNKYTESIRQSAVKKMTAAYNTWMKTVPEDYNPGLEDDNR